MLLSCQVTGYLGQKWISSATKRMVQIIYNAGYDGKIGELYFSILQLPRCKRACLSPCEALHFQLAIPLKDPLDMGP